MTDNPFSDLNFNPPPRLRLSPRSLWMMAIAAGYWLLRWMLPTGGFSWLLYFLLVILAWVASFGWRAAIREIAAWIHMLERF